jgi:hypothetical protein
VLLVVGLLTAVIPVRGSMRIQPPSQAPEPIVRVP